MKKLQVLSIEKLFLFCGFSLALTLAGFWHYHSNVGQTEKLTNLKEGVSTCFSRITQTFTAAMIKDQQSSFLKRDFMALSDECLNENLKSFGAEKATLVKTYKTLGTLITEVYWFHEKVVKITVSALSASGATSAEIPMNSLNEKYEKIEGLKLDVADQLDSAIYQLKSLRFRDEVMVGVAFALFLVSMSLLAFKQIANLRNLSQQERQALLLLNSGNDQIGAMVDNLINKILVSQGMNVSAQVFRDYHGHLLERISPEYREQVAQARGENQDNRVSKIIPVPIATVEAIIEEAGIQTSDESTKGLSVQAVINEWIMATSVSNNVTVQKHIKEARLEGDAETLQQILHASVNKFMLGSGASRVHINFTGEANKHRYLLELCLSGLNFNVSELEFLSGNSSVIVDQNLILMNALALDAGINVEAKNQINKKGKIVGATYVFSLPLVKEKALVSVVRGRKRDLQKSMGSEISN